MIEPVDVSEAPAVLAFIERVVVSAVDATPESKRVFLENLRLNIQRWVEDPQRSVHLKDVEDGELRGIVLVRDFWNLCGLFVAPAYHRRGIGSGLLREAVTLCRRKAAAPAIRLNAAYNAVDFYKALGFREVEGRHPVVSAVAMEYPL